MSLSETLEGTRRRLFDRFRAAEGPRQWLELQLRIAGAVLRAERQRETASKEDRSDLGWHIELCRAYGDAIVWRTVHSHAIRHHVELPGRAPHLGGIREQLRQYAAFASVFANWGLPAILPDLTNIWRLGDVVVVGDPESLEVVEFKGFEAILPDRLWVFFEAMAGKAGFPMAAKEDGTRRRGRAARQLRAIQSRYSHLVADRGRLPGDLKDRVAIQLSTPPSHLYEYMGQAVEQALVEGYGEQVCSPHQMVAAARADYVHDGKLTNHKPFLRDARAPVAEMNLWPSAPLWWVAPPPTEWTLGPEATWSLMDGDVYLLHIVDLAAFESLSGDGVEFRVSEVDAKYVIDVRVSDYELQLGDRFFWDLLFGFEQLESVARRAREFVARSVTIAEAERAQGDGPTCHDL